MRLSTTYLLERGPFSPEGDYVYYDLRIEYDAEIDSLTNEKMIEITSIELEGLPALDLEEGSYPLPLIPLELSHIRTYLLDNLTTADLEG